MNGKAMPKSSDPAMNAATGKWHKSLSTEEVRDDFIPTSAYLSPEFQKLEYERMWNQVWQVACREEEIPRVGDYVTYEIGDQAFIVIRTAEDRIQSFYNVCLHRGRRLTSGTGSTSRFHCKYHGWQWNLDGSNARVLDREDWKGCSDMDDADLHLRETLVDRWAGFVFINMNLAAEPLMKFLDRVPEFLDCFEFEKMRYRWYVSVKAPCNWKVGLEAFVEGYHVSATHPQWPQFIDDVTRSATYGKHGMFAYPTARPFGQPSVRLNRPMLEDVRENLIAFYDDLNHDACGDLFGARHRSSSQTAHRSFARRLAHGNSRQDVPVHS